MKLILYCVAILGSLPNSLTLKTLSVDCIPKYTTGSKDEVCGFEEFWIGLIFTHVYHIHSVLINCKMFPLCITVLLVLLLQH